MGGDSEFANEQQVEWNVQTLGNFGCAYDSPTRQAKNDCIGGKAQVPKRAAENLTGLSTVAVPVHDLESTTATPPTLDPGQRNHNRPPSRKLSP